MGDLDQISLSWLAKHGNIMLTRIRLSAKLPRHKYNLWLVSYSFLLSGKLLSNIFAVAIRNWAQHLDDTRRSNGVRTVRMNCWPQRMQAIYTMLDPFTISVHTGNFVWTEILKMSTWKHIGNRSALRKTTIWRWSFQCIIFIKRECNQL